MSTKTVDKANVFVSQSADQSAILTYRITLVNDGVSEANVEVADLLPDNTTYYQQYVNEGPNGYNGTYVAKWWNDTGEHGYFWPDGDDIRWSSCCRCLPIAKSATISVNGNGCVWVGPSTSGRVYIEYKVKVDHGFAGAILNKADVTLYDTWDGNIHEAMALRATTNVRYGIFLPLMFR